MKLSRVISLTLVVLIAAFLVTSGLSIALQGGDDRATRSDNANQFGLNDDDDDDDDDDDGPGNGFEERENERERRLRIGEFNNRPNGDYVSFELNNEGVVNYTRLGNESDILLFKSVVIEGWNLEEDDSRGSFYELEGDETEVKIYDVPAALMKISSESEEGNRTITFNLGEFTVNRTMGKNLLLTYGNLSAKILHISHGDDSWEDRVDIQTTDKTVTYTFEDELDLLFRICDYGEEHQELNQEQEREREMEQEVHKEISNGTIGGEVSVDRNKSQYRYASVSYSDMQIMTQVMERNRLRVMVSSETLGENGKVVAMNIYRRMINVSNQEQLRVEFDGKQISHADDVSDLKDTSDGPEYLLTLGKEKIQVMVMVPHFSTHTIEISKVIEEDMIGNLQYFLPAIGITALAIVGTAWITKKER